MKCRTESFSSSGDATFQRVCDDPTIPAHHEGVVGVLDIAKLDRKLLGKTVWFVNGLDVFDPYKRRGHATAMYEAAAAYACRKHGRLASVNREEDSFSNSFWEKQERLGRATRIPHAGYEKKDAFVLDVCHQKDRGIDLSGFEAPRWLKPALLGGVALLLLGAASGSPTAPSGPPLAVRADRKRFGPVLDAAAVAHGLSEALVRAVAWVESRWNPIAGSPVGAVGLLQLMPGTATSLGVTDRTDPTQNANGGAKFLASLYQRAGSWPVALAAYNWGPGNVFGYTDSSGRVHPPHMYSGQWPANTQQYVREILDAEVRGVS